jgi:hypothetical protein
MQMRMLLSYAGIAALSLIAHEMQFSAPPFSAKLRQAF